MTSQVDTKIIYFSPVAFDKYLSLILIYAEKNIFNGFTKTPRREMAPVAIKRNFREVNNFIHNKGKWLLACKIHNNNLYDCVVDRYTFKTFSFLIVKQSINR